MSTTAGSHLTSDPHVGHKHIIEYSKRPFKDLDEMHAELIRRWNAKVTPDGHVYLLGDFGLCPVSMMKEYRDQLNGRITFILGNHDSENRLLRVMHTQDNLVTGTLYTTLDGHRVAMQHKNPESYSLKDRPFQYLLCGHVHEAWDRRGNVINVGVDVRDFEPKTLAELLK